MLLKRFIKKDPIAFYGYIKGDVVDLCDVNDPVFSQKMMGEGVAIQPCDGSVYAPCDAEVVFVAPTSHAIGMKTKEGIEFLLHLGLDTVHVKEGNITVLCKVGDVVAVHQKIAQISEELLNGNEYDMISILVFTNISDHHIQHQATGFIDPQQLLLELEK